LNLNLLQPKLKIPFDGFRRLKNEAKLLTPPARLLLSAVDESDVTQELVVGIDEQLDDDDEDKDDVWQLLSISSDRPVPDKSNKNERCIVTKAWNFAGNETFMCCAAACRC
jgi:hypothetical protein